MAKKDENSRELKPGEIDEALNFVQGLLQGGSPDANMDNPMVAGVVRTIAPKPNPGFTKGEPMNRAEFRSLKPGDWFWVYWAKDDNPEDVRFNNPEQVLEFVPGVGRKKGYVRTEDADWEEPIDETGNDADTSRGYAYYYHVEK